MPQLDVELFKACEEANNSEVERLIASGADVNKGQTKDGATPLFVASEKGHLNVVERLIASNADVNKARTDDGITPLFIASQFGHLNVVERLIAAGADVNKARTDIGVTPLYVASQHGHVTIVEQLIATGADINKARTDNNVTPIYVASDGGHLNVVERLIAAGADINKTTITGGTPINVASYYGYLQIVERLITAGADVNKARTDIGTPLFVASEKGHLNVVERLIAAGADVNKARTNDGPTPLFIASQFGHLNVVERLIAAGADVNKARTDIGVTPLYVASQHGRVTIVEQLIAAGADVNKARTDNNVTPIYVASEKGHMNVIERLIAAGADINKTTTSGGTPIYLASYYGYLQIVERLITAGADVNKARTDTGKTSLYIAAQNGHINIVKKLIDSGADKTIRAINGTLPIDVAKTEEIRKLLKDAPKNPIKWLGWSRGDASMLDGVFGDEATARNFALCPVCMKYVIRKDACMYMSHNCSEQRGYYHDTLYQKYRNSEGIINWCTVCGRICKGHSHFKLGPSQGDVPPIIIGKDPFAPSCEGEGGGGVTEKLLRFRRLREHAKDLQDEVGKIDWWEAMDELCEEMWNAPMVKPKRVLATMLETKKFNIPNTNFPLTISPVENAPNIPYNGLMPIVHPIETEAFQNAMYIDDSNIIQFRHRKADGSMNNHDGPGQQISREAFVGWLKDVLADPTSFRFGRCWQFKTAAQLTALTAAQKAHVCDAILHPEEVKAALDMADEEQRKLAEGYHKAFNVAMDTRRTIRP